MSADAAATPWYLSLSTWINIVQGILGLLVAAGGAGLADHVVSTPDVGAGLGITGLSVAHQVRAMRSGLRPADKPKGIDKY